VLGWAANGEGDLVALEMLGRVLGDTPYALEIASGPDGDAPFELGREGGHSRRRVVHHRDMTGAEIELMNLAGPRTGLEMMQPIGRTMPTSNFFSEMGYYRNTIVREKTAAELLAALNDRMEVNMKKAGAVEFAEIFDEVARR